VKAQLRRALVSLPPPDLRRQQRRIRSGAGTRGRCVPGISSRSTTRIGLGSGVRPLLSLYGPPTGERAMPDGRTAQVPRAVPTRYATRPQESTLGVEPAKETWSYASPSKAHEEAAKAEPSMSFAPLFRPPPPPDGLGDISFPLRPFLSGVRRPPGAGRPRGARPRPPPGLPAPVRDTALLAESRARFLVFPAGVLALLRLGK
jgi:hypothetical protein